MVDTYSNRSRLILAPKGSHTDDWAPVVNGNMQLIDQGMDGSATIALASATTYTLTTADGAADQARCRVLSFTGTQNCTVTVPAVEKLYTIINGSVGALTFTTGSGTTTAIPAAERAQIYVSSTGVTLVTSSREWRQVASAGTGTPGATITQTIGTGEYFDSSQLELRSLGHDDGSSQNLMLALETSTGGTYGTAISILNTVAAVGTERVYGNITIERKGLYIDIVARVGKTGSFTNPLLQCTSTSFTASLAAMGDNVGIRLSWSGGVNFNIAQGIFARFQR